MNISKITKLNLVNLSMPTVSLSFAWYLQIFQNVIPCSLCLLQRWGMYLSFGFILVGLIFLYLE